jgi:hypothetical protein
LEKVLIGFAGGVVSGALAGYLLALFVWWGQDLRDARLRAARIPLPSDRVFRHYHWPLAALGGINGAALTLALDVSPVLAALSMLVIPASYLPLLALSALFTWFGPSPRPIEFDPSSLLGKDMTEAETVLRQAGLWFRVIDDRSLAPPIPVQPYPTRHPASYVELALREGRVVRATLRE